MKYYFGNSKPYIYVSFDDENEEWVTPLLLKLSEEKVLFCKNRKVTKRELKRVKAAHAVLFFVTQKYYESDEFRQLVDEAVRDNKNILTVFLESIEFDAWGHMQLDSAQTLSVKNSADDEAFYEKLKDSEIFRNMKVTSQQKRFRRNTVLSAVLIPIVSAALIYGIVVYPLLIVPAREQLIELEDTFGIKGITQEELDSITEINIMGTDVYAVLSDVGTGQTEADGTIGYELVRVNGLRESKATKRGNISDLSSLKSLKNLKTLRICANNITDLSPLAECPNLERIVVENNPIRSLEGLEKLEKLYELSINYTDVDDLTPIANLTSLKILGVNFTPVSQLPDTETIQNLDMIFAEGTYITSIPYLGERDQMTNINLRRRIGDGKISDYSFLKDVHKIISLSLESAKVEELKPYLSDTELYEINMAGLDITSLRDLDWINVTFRLDVCHSQSLESLEGIEHFEGIEVLVLKGCVNLTDLTPCLKLKSLKRLEIYEDQRELAESQLQDATFDIEYMSE